MAYISFICSKEFSFPFENGLTFSSRFPASLPQHRVVFLDTLQLHPT